MLPELSSYILKDWDKLFPSVYKPQGIRYLGIPGSVEGGASTFLSFIDNVSKPLFAVKIYRDAHAAERASNEKEMLDSLELRKDILGASVPHPILCERMGGMWVLVSSVLDGAPMIATMTDEGVPQLEIAAKNICLAADWLTRLYEATQEHKAAGNDCFIQNQLEEFSRLYDVSDNECSYLDLMCNEFRNAVNWRSGVQHGDFCRHNLLISQSVSGTKVSVIDWTDSRRMGIPLYDLFFFLTTYYLQVRKQSGIQGFIRAFEDTFFNEGPYKKIVMECLKTHCGNVGVKVSKVDTLFALFLIERAIFESRQVRRCLKRGIVPRFTLYLAGLENLNYHQATGAQIWIHFFKKFVSRGGHLAF